MSHSSFSYLRLFILIAALLLCVGPVVSAPSPKDGKGGKDGKDGKDDKDSRKGIMIVRDRESIQKAINNAPVGARIEVYGRHNEQVEITKDGITLIGKDAKLFPPDSYDKHNFCYGTSQNAKKEKTSAGICIHGKDIDLITPYDEFAGHLKVKEVGKPVKNVQVSGFEITGFDGQNIAIYGAKDTKISQNKLKKGGRYGFLTVGSTGTEASDNMIIGSAPTTLDSGLIGMCMDDKSSALFSKNNISDYFIGLCTETDGGVNKGNWVHNCCLGNIIDPDVKGAKSIGNQILQWNRHCNESSIGGISLLGSINELIEGNYIDGIKTDKSDGAGLFLGDFFGPVNQGNTIRKNVFGKNGVDIFDASVGKNDIRSNTCDRAFKGTIANPEAAKPAPEFCR